MNNQESPAAGRRVTIRTVAADAGVSVAAVSKVLRDAYGVSESLRQRVNASIERLGYRPSVAARGMRGRTYTVGILLVEIANPFVADIVDGVNRVLAPSRYQALMGMGQARQPLESSLIEAMIDSRMDGLILVASMIEREVVEHFARKIPIVAIGHHDPGTPVYDTVNADDAAGAGMAVAALVERGYRDVALVTPMLQGQPEGSVIRTRLAGYRAAMARLLPGAEPRVLELPVRTSEPENEARRVQAMRALLSAPDRPAAVFVWSDLDAVLLINVARGMGLSVPGDLAIIGYDNSWVAGLPLVGLASVDQAGHELGATAAELLLSRISGRSEARHILRRPFVVTRPSF
jgi:LacI family transcriptional regulator